MKFGELGKRVAVGIIGIPLIFTVTLIGEIYFLLLVNIILTLSLWEFYGLAEKKGFYPLKIFGILSTLIISWDLYFYQGKSLEFILFFILFLNLIFELFKGKSHSLVNAAVTFFGIGYISLFSSFILIRELPSNLGAPNRVGGWLVLFIFLIIWICDTAAYLWGYRFGKHPLFLRVSPKKTWEGAIAGFVVGTASAFGLRYLLIPSISMVDSIVIGTIVGILGQTSDLVESLYKRDSGVKDSSKILPGHGGILDRFDSPLFVGPFVYLYFILRGIPF